MTEQDQMTLSEHQEQAGSVFRAIELAVMEIVTRDSAHAPTPDNFWEDIVYKLKEVQQKWLSQTRRFSSMVESANVSAAEKREEVLRSLDWKVPPLHTHSVASEQWLTHYAHLPGVAVSSGRNPLYDDEHGRLMPSRPYIVQAVGGDKCPHAVQTTVQPCARLADVKTAGYDPIHSGFFHMCTADELSLIHI